MNLYETQGLFKQIHPNKEISFEFDNNCIRSIEIIYTEGNAHQMNHIEYNKLKVTVLGDSPVYVTISPHRIVFPLAWIKNLINSENIES